MSEEGEVFDGFLGVMIPLPPTLVHFSPGVDIGEIANLVSKEVCLCPVML